MKIFSVQNFGAEFEVGNVLQITFLALLFSSLSFAVAKRFGRAMVSFLLACCLFALQTFFNISRNSEGLQQSAQQSASRWTVVAIRVSP